MAQPLRAFLPPGAACLAAAIAVAAPAATPSVVVEVFHRQDTSGTVTLEVPGSPPCVIDLRGDGKESVACTVPLPEAVKAVRLTGEVRWKHWKDGKRVSKGTQSWKVLDARVESALKSMSQRLSI